MLPNGFNYLSTVLAAQQQLLFAQRGVVPINAVPGLPIGIPLPASTPTRPSPMLVPPGMGAEDSATTDSPDSEWTEHKHTDGRIYYHNRVTKQSSWVKPDALKSADEKSQPVWREYQTEDGKSYYYNLATKKTTWTKPEGEEIAKFDQKSSSSAAASSSTPAEKSTAETSEKPAESKMKQEESEMEKAMKATLASMINVPLPAEKSGKNEEILATNDEGELKKRQAERFRDLLRDKYNDGKISTTCNWDQAVKFIQNDPRFRILTKVSEKKQLFNAWKVQRQKEERDEKRLAIKKAKEDLEKFLQENRQVKETLKYSKACEIFGKEPIWQAVNDEDRHDIFRDCLKFVAKRDEEKKKEVQTKNIQSLSAILQSMDQITYKTTWAQAQRLLIENPAFANDTTLQIMDKEDALIVFEEHIKAAEIEHIEQKKLESKRLRRQERKVREQFQQLLAELHKKGELTSVSLWKDLFSGISADHRFDAMLLQSGSTPLDLFKFFVEDLKEQYTEDRKRIKEILAEKNLEVRPNTEYDLFSEWVLSHPNGGKVDHGNMKLCYNSMIEKAESKVKDEEREIARKKRRIENEYKGLLKAQEVGIETDWNVLKGNIEKEKAYEAVGSEEECEKLFRDYVTALNEACHHIHAPSNGEKSKKKKKDKKKKSKKEERADSESEGEIREKKKKKKHSKDRSDDESGKKLKKSRKRSHSEQSDYEVEKKRRHESDSN